MDHVAIMRKGWGMLPKILAEEKTIESRWYKNKAAPWGKIQTGDTVYFKNSGEPVSVRVRVRRILSFENLNPARVKEILEKYGRDDGIEKEKLQDYFNLFKHKKYGLLIFLERPEKIVPFEIDKTGFGAMAAWISVGDINEIRSKNSVPRSGV
jgi:ASC-1-like (ASCH) protein